MRSRQIDRMLQELRRLLPGYDSSGRLAQQTIGAVVGGVWR